VQQRYLSIVQDRDGNYWVVVRKGADYIEIGEPFQLLEDVEQYLRTLRAITGHPVRNR
jgi:hypothetical protein